MPLAECPANADALPYIDTAIDDDEEQRAIAMKLVDDEMDVYAPSKDYIEHLPPVNSKRHYLECLEKEYERFNAERDTQPLDHKLTDLSANEPPANPSSDESTRQAWKDCVNQLRIRIETRQAQLANLERLNDVDADWDQFLRQCESVEASIKAELDDLNRQTEEINWKRKSEQEQVGRVLRVLKGEWDSLVERNRVLAREITKQQSL